METPNSKWKVADIKRWLSKRGVKYGQSDRKAKLLQRAAGASSNPCAEDTPCGRLLNAMGHILNGSGALGKGTEPISHYLIPAVLSSSGTPAIFGGQIFYNAEWTGTKYVGAFIGDTSASQKEQANAISAHRKVVGYPMVLDTIKPEFQKLLEKLKAHIQLMRDDLSAPNYFVEVSQDGATHYNALVVARDKSGQPVAYYYEPHNVFTAEEKWLPYGYAARRLEELLDVSFHYGECGFVHQDDRDTLCQTWSLWFAYLLCSGKTYEEAQQFVGEEHIDGLIAFVMFVYTVPFTTLNYRGSPQFVGSLTKGSVRGREYSIKSYIEDDWRGNLQEMGLGDLVPPDENKNYPKLYKGLKFTTTNPSRGKGRYMDRAWL